MQILEQLFFIFLHFGKYRYKNRASEETRLMNYVL